MPKQEASIYRLKVTLAGSKPPIWRRILVRSDTRLDRLHDILQVVMGWEEAHLHEFDVGGVTYGVAEPGWGLEVRNERRAVLSDVLPHEKAKLSYTYDMGDSWEHNILLEQILPIGEGVQTPSCITGKRACPPEDCGGIWGYENLLQILADPKHPEHDDYLDWLGGEFDPEAFDMEAVNERLRAMSSATARRRKPSS